MAQGSALEWGLALVSELGVEVALDWYSRKHSR